MNRVNTYQVDIKYIDVKGLNNDISKTLYSEFDAYSLLLDLSNNLYSWLSESNLNDYKNIEILNINLKKLND